MKKNKIVAVFMLTLLCLTCVLPSFACASDSEDTSFETFLSVLKAWGTFLAKITGSYDTLDNISIFSNFARMWHDFIGSEEFSVERLFEAIMRWLGISIMMQQEEVPQESYSI
ncbi:MAG: hypothetical protein PHG52_00465 [Synergistaceae bacterium]|nr:hypothetical protein [Synergistaceae bacterium]MDD4704251.1 hypothetical protein [Synergistaceae bacterium]